MLQVRIFCANIIKFLFTKFLNKNIFIYSKLCLLLLVFEKLLVLINKNFLKNFTTWKKYLKEKHWSNKEKLSWLKTWARKNEGKLSTYKGFYIPVTLPQTDQAKFFQKKRDEDEKKLRDKFYKLSDSNEQWIKRTTVKRDEKTFYDLQLLELKSLSNIEECWIDNWLFLTLPRKKNFQKNFWLKFSKKFLKSINFGLKIFKYQHLWSYYNLGYNTTDFLNFFLIQSFPPYLINFNFTKLKILLIKKFKNIFFYSTNTIKKNIFLKNLSLVNLQSLFKLGKLLKSIYFDKFFFFLKIYKNWFDSYNNNYFYKTLLHLIIITSKKKTFVGKFIYNIFSSIKNIINLTSTNKKFINNILLARLQGTFLLNFSWSKLRWKNIYTMTFLFAKLNPSYIKIIVKNFQLLKIFDKKINLLGLSNLILFLENIFSNYSTFFTNINLLEKNNFSSFLEKFSFFGYSITNDFFMLSRNLSKTFFQFLKNWIKHYQQIWFLFYNSFSHQVKILNDFNVAEILFWFIIWKGKKLTARKVFLKFLKKFKKKYSLPPLLIFTHALLLIEPKIWVKEKKIAGRQYDIPIYISPNWSKRIAIWWLLQAAKKRKWASITESLSQEVWDACFKKGGAFLNKDNLHQTVKWNKAYMRWF